MIVSHGLILGVPLAGAPIFCLILSLLIQKDGGNGPDDVLATNQLREWCQFPPANGGIDKVALCFLPFCE